MLTSALKDAGIEVIGCQPGTLVDDHRGGAVAVATVTLSPTGADALVRRLTGEGIASRDLAATVRAALNAQHIGGRVTHDRDSGSVGLASLTEGVVADLIQVISPS